MNIPTTTNGSPAPASAAAPIIPNGVVAVAAATDADKAACGRIVMWSLHGDMTVAALTLALEASGSKAIAPEAPSALVALHRAVDAVAKALGRLEVHHVARGEWAVVGKPEEQTDADGAQRKLVYGIECTAKLVRPEGGGEEYLEIAGKGEAEIRSAYEVAKSVLAPSDIGTWLTEKAAKLGAIPLRDRGGVYFVPQPQVWKWELIVRALKRCSKHGVHNIPAMRSQDAVEAIMSALTADTQAACDKIASDLSDGELGSKALANREKITRELLDRVSQYEALLGNKLDALRGAIAETQSAVATAALATSADS